MAKVYGPFHSSMKGIEEWLAACGAITGPAELKLAIDVAEARDRGCVVWNGPPACPFWWKLEVKVDRAGGVYRFTLHEGLRAIHHLSANRVARR